MQEEISIAMNNTASSLSLFDTSHHFQLVLTISFYRMKKEWPTKVKRIEFMT